MPSPFIQDILDRIEKLEGKNPTIPTSRQGYAVVALEQEVRKLNVSKEYRRRIEDLEARWATLVLHQSRPDWRTHLSADYVVDSKGFGTHLHLRDAVEEARLSLVDKFIWIKNNATASDMDIKGLASGQNIYIEASDRDQVTITAVAGEDIFKQTTNGGQTSGGLHFRNVGFACATNKGVYTCSTSTEMKHLDFDNCRMNGGYFARQTGDTTGLGNVQLRVHRTVGSALGFYETEGNSGTLAPDLLEATDNTLVLTEWWTNDQAGASPDFLRVFGGYYSLATQLTIPNGTDNFHWSGFKLDYSAGDAAFFSADATLTADDWTWTDIQFQVSNAGGSFCQLGIFYSDPNSSGFGLYIHGIHGFGIAGLSITQSVIFIEIGDDASGEDPWGTAFVSDCYAPEWGILFDGHGTLYGDRATVSDLLSATHEDTLAAAVVDGSIIIGNVTPKWSRLAIAVPAANVRNTLGIDNGEVRPSWKTTLDTTNAANLGTAAPGTSLIYSHRDHVHSLSAVDHDALTNFVGGEHVLHSGVTLTAGLGLSGGGTIASNRTFDLKLSELTAETIAAADEIPFNDVTDDGSHSITFATLEAALSHDALANFASNEHFSNAGAFPTTWSDTGITGAELEDLSDGGATTIHSHAADTHAMLGSTIHTDTLTSTVARGNLIVANSTPKYAALAKGAAGSLLTSDGTDPTWQTNISIAGTLGVTGATTLSGGIATSTTLTGTLTTTANVAAEGGTITGGKETVAGLLQLHGSPSASSEGGEIRLHLADDHDTTFASWNIDVNANDLRFFSSDAAVTNIMTAEGQLKLSVTGSGAGIAIGGDTLIYRSGVSTLFTPDKFNFEAGIFTNTITELISNSGVTIEGMLLKDGRLALGTGTDTISSDEIVTPTGGFITAAAQTSTTDDLDGIGEGVDGRLIIVRADVGDTITVKHNNAGGGTGRKILLNDNADLALVGNDDDSITLMYDEALDSANGAWFEIGRGSGTAHTIASHADTSGTGAELNTLTGGADAGTLHLHQATNVTYAPAVNGDWEGLADPGDVDDGLDQLAARSGEVRVTDAGTQTLTNNTATAIAMDAERWDTDAFHSTSVANTRLTVPTGMAGYYNIGAIIGFATHATGFRFVRILLNGTTNIGETRGIAGGGNWNVVACNIVYKLAATDYVEVIAYQNSGGDLDTVKSANITPEFWMSRTMGVV